MSLREILEYNFINLGGFQLNLAKIGVAILVLIGIRLALWMINRFLLRGFFRRHEKVDEGRQYAIRQFFKYLLYIFGAYLVLEVLGVQISAIWAGAAALLIGAGLGLQQAVSDLFSGVVLLSEGTVEVGDIVIVDGLVCKVVKIGLRTSKVVTREDTTILIPNSKLVMEKVTNWSYSESPARFEIKVSVAQDSDVRLVEKLLLQSAITNSRILKSLPPQVQLIEIAKDTFDFRLLFYAAELMQIETIKSEVRFDIVRLFRENGVKIGVEKKD